MAPSILPLVFKEEASSLNLDYREGTQYTGDVLEVGKCTFFYQNELWYSNPLKEDSSPSSWSKRKS